MTVFVIASVLLAVAFGTALVRAALGPTVADRAVAADVGLYVLIGILAVIAAVTGRSQFVDVALIGTLLGFLATVALAALVGRQRR
jgi:multicomponent Na+:H+ antiporter subunit F